MTQVKSHPSISSQEHEHLRKSVGRIAELQPDVLMVEKTVSRLAQDFLLDAGIALVLNVKQVRLMRQL